MLIGGLRVLLRAAGVFLALGMIALAVVFGSSTVRLGGVFVMFGSLVVLISRHFGLVGYLRPAATKASYPEWFLSQWDEPWLKGAALRAYALATTVNQFRMTTCVFL